MKAVPIRCPSCGREDVLPIDTARFPIILNCPTCRSTFLNYRDKTFELDQNTIQKLFAEGHAEKISEYFWGVIEKGKNMKPEIEKRPIITHDDVVDLKIALGLCRSVDEFLEMMEHQPHRNLSA